MVHPNTERLTEYWRERREAEAAPSRASIDPMAFHDLLPQVFIVGRGTQGRYPFRLVGGFVADLHQTDLRGRDLLDLWRPADRWSLKGALEQARLRQEPVTVLADVLIDGGPAEPMEVWIAPLVGPSGEIDRFLGLYQPTGVARRMLERPVRMLAARGFSGAEAIEPLPGLRLASVDGRRIA